jgi:hypothetical protein
MFKIGYKQTIEHKNKINTPERARKISESLKRLYKNGERICWTKGKKLSNEHKLNIKNSCKYGEKNKSWKGENAGYFSIHDWIKKYFGKANKCENRENDVLNFTCSNKSNIFQWAKKRNHRYSRLIEDYYQLCVSCHSKYDIKREEKKCKLDGCNRKMRRFGYCEKHGIRFKKWGNPLAKKSHHNPLKILDKID